MLYTFFEIICEATDKTATQNFMRHYKVHGTHEVHATIISLIFKTLLIVAKTDKLLLTHGYGIAFS